MMDTIFTKNFYSYGKILYRMLNKKKHDTELIYNIVIFKKLFMHMNVYI